MAGRTRTLSLSLKPYVLRPRPPRPRAPYASISSIMVTVGVSLPVLWNQNPLKTAPKPGYGSKATPSVLHFSNVRLSCCTTLQTAQFHLTTQNQRRPKRPLGARKGAPDAHDALPPRLPYDFQKRTKNAPCLGGEPHRSCLESGRVPRCRITAPGKGNIGSDDAQGCGVGGTGVTPERLRKAPVRRSKHFTAINGVPRPAVSLRQNRSGERLSAGLVC